MNAVALAGDRRIVDPLIQRFVNYWEARRGLSKYPARADLDPLDFRYVLGDVVMIEVQKAGGIHQWHFRYRLIGSNVAERDGYDLTGKTLEDLPEPEYRERIRETWTEVCESGRAAHYIREIVLDGRTRHYEVVVLPLASNGEDIDMLISVQRESRAPDPRAVHAE